MKYFLKSSDKQGQLHSIMLPSITMVFLVANYIIFTEVGPLLYWNLSFHWLFVLILLGFIISWINMGTINKEYRKVKAVLSETETSQAALQTKLKTLSRKEREVLHLILLGKSNQQICDELFISLSTLKSHIINIYRNMEVGRR